MPSLGENAGAVIEALEAEILEKKQKLAELRRAQPRDPLPAYSFAKRETLDELFGFEIRSVGGVPTRLLAAEPPRPVPRGPGLGDGSRAETREMGEGVGGEGPVLDVAPTRFASQVLLDPNFDESGSLAAFLPGEVEPVGYSLAVARKVKLENAPDDFHRGYITLFAVDPSHRGKGIGSALLNRAESFLRDRQRSEAWISPYAPGYFTPGVDVAAQADGLAFLLRRGYVEVYRPLSMETDLTSLQEPAWLNEVPFKRQNRPVEVVPFGVEHARPAIEFAERHFPGDWVRVVRETGREILAGARPDRLLLAIDRDRREVVGFSHYGGERFGPVGVAESERGQGVGQWLTSKTLQAQKDAGYGRAYFMWSDDRTASRLYNHFGFKEARRFAVLKKIL